MAEPILETVIENLGSALLKELGLLRHVRKDMDKLRSNLLVINSVLEDAEKKSIRDGPVRVWLSKLKTAAFDADHVVDEYQTEALLRRIPRSLLMQVRVFFTPHNPIIFRHRMAQKIKGVSKRLDEIAEEKQKYGLAEGSTSASERFFNDRETHSLVIESDVHGRDEDKKKVIDLLIDTDNDSDVSILPIFGLGGVGKTTLAQLVYNNHRIKNHFELHVWVCVSETFEEKNIIGNILECITKQKCNLSNLQTMKEELREKLSNKKFLLVFDDVWNETELKWEGVKLLFRGSKNGSKILVTTRSERVARIMGTIDPYQLKGLTDDDCWTLFRERAFGMGREEEMLRLMEIGKEIVAKCGGLPLAAKALGSLMSSRRGEAEWLAIKNSEIWELPAKDTENILPALRLSYDHLPSQLKQCFVYCSLYPKDYILDKEKLIKLWIAEGFIPSADNAEDAEVVGNRYFNVLLWSSLFQDVEKDDYGNIVRCKMHDLVHDLACYVAGKERCTMEADREGSSTSREEADWEGISREAGCESDDCRYVSVTFEGNERSVIPKKCYKLKKLRTFLTMCSSRYSPYNLVGLHWGKLSTHLRVLDLSESRIEELPDNLDRLKHLRFLDLSSTRIMTLPASIISLQNLQTLNLRYCHMLERLPEGIIFLSRLRHLDWSYTYNLSCMPCGMGRLNNLRTLPKIIVGKERGRSIVELQHLNLIRGDLEITGLCNVKDANQAGLANLAAKTGLQRLQLYSEENWPSSAGNIDDVDVDVLENLRPPNNLKELKIHSFAGSRLPSWMTTMESSLPNLVKIELSGFKRCEHLPPLGHLPNLVKIELQNLHSCEHLPPLGHLPSLKYLHISNAYAVRRIGGEFYGDGGTFPSLQILKLWGMPELEEWSIATESGMESSTYPRLELLEIRYCPKLSRVQPCILSSATELWIDGSNEELLSGRCLGVGGGGMPSKIKKVHIWHSTASSVSGYWEGLQHLINLEGLTIAYCTASSVSGYWVGLQHLINLEELAIESCSEMTCLPEGILHHHFPKLKSLTLKLNDQLVSLAGGGGDGQLQPPPFFTALQRLHIQDCSSLTVLPEWLVNLTTLQELKIYGCPLLKTRYKRESVQDWNKIAHIPSVTITSQRSITYWTREETDGNGGFAFSCNCW